jgi:acyl carrier protein
VELTDERIAEEVSAVLVSEFEVDAAKITPVAHLFTDLELDSLDGIDLIIALEKRFGVKVDEESAKEFRRVGDVCGFIGRLRDARARAAPPKL